MAKQYVVLTRMPNGQWLCGNCEPMSLRKAEKLSMFNRIMGGYTTRTYPADEHDCADCTPQHEHALKGKENKP